MNENDFEKINIIMEISTWPSTSVEISVNLKNFIFWDQICRKYMSENNFEKINIKIEISIW